MEHLPCRCSSGTPDGTSPVPMQEVTDHKRPVNSKQRTKPALLEDLAVVLNKQGLREQEVLNRSIHRPGHEK